MLLKLLRREIDMVRFSCRGQTRTRVWNEAESTRSYPWSLFPAQQFGRSIFPAALDFMLVDGQLAAIQCESKAASGPGNIGEQRSRAVGVMFEAQLESHYT